MLRRMNRRHASPEPSLTTGRSRGISIVTETYPPEVNGVAMTMAHLTHWMAQHHTVQLVRVRQSGDDGREPDARYRTELVPGVGIPGYAGLRLGLPATGRLKRLWRRERPDHVHIVTEGPLGRSAMKAALALGIPVTTAFHTNFHTYMHFYGMRPLYRPALWYLRRLHNRSRATLVPTRELADELAGLGLTALKIVARGVDTRVFDPIHRSDALRAEWGVDPDVIFAGLRRWDVDLAAHYASADLFLFSSLSETFGNVTLEAMASGLPVVAFNYGAARQHIRHGDNGLTVSRDDPAAFIDCVRQLARDPGLRIRLGTEARATCETIDWNDIGLEFETALLEESS